ncbi:MAG: FG-GAP-like repeat-containing protein [Kofleriaceae bacterium]
MSLVRSSPSGLRLAGLSVTLSALLAVPAHAAQPTAGALTPERLKLPSGPNSVRGLAEEPTVDPFYAQVGYEVPIEVPEGYGKLAPALALTYSGALGNGPLGIGWDMPGARIERSLRLGVPSFTAADELELVGPVSGRLVAIGNNEYRVEGMGQTVRVRKVGEGFEVDAGDGTRWRFGATAASRQEPGVGRTAAWLVEEQTNLAGERVAYTYQHDQGQVYLQRVTWGPGQVYAVDLTYVARPDVTVSYREGFRVVTGRRLSRLAVTSFGAERRAYQLHYDDAFAVSRLAQVTATGLGGAGAWPALTFDYATANPAAITAVPNVGSWRLNSNGISLVDLDGDGASDLLALSSGGHSYRLNQNGVFGAALALGGNTSSITSLQLMDIDGDARPDLLQDSGSGWTVWKWTRSTWLLQPGGVWPGSAGLALKNPASTRFADLNGDGLIDAIKWNNDGLEIYQASRTGFAPPRSAPRIGGVLVPGTSGRFQDGNGDGLDDYVVLAPDHLDLYVGRGDGTFDAATSRAYPFAGSLGNPDDVHLADLDRDDLLDLVRVDLGTVRWFRGRADGTFAPTPVTLANPEPLATDVVVTIADVNGNGSQDVVWSSASNIWRLDLAGPTNAGMLRRVRNGLGLDVAFTYRSAHELSVEARAASDPWLYELPIAMPVPVRKTTELGPGEPPRQIDYLVRDGYWDAAERRFGGFLGSIVTTWGATPAQTSSVQTKYHNGAGLNRVLRGKPLVEQVRDGTGQRLSITINTWEATAIQGLSSTNALLRKAVLRDRRIRHEDTLPILESRQSHTYDALGRLQRTVELGRLDLPHDDTVKEFRYADDPATWVRDQLCEEKLLSNATPPVLVSHTQYLFGDETTEHPLCVVGKGWPRRTQRWLASESRFVTSLAQSYDAHGNAVHTTQGGVTRHLVYDAEGLFPVEERVDVAPGQQQAWTTSWDRQLGLAVTLTDPNGHVVHAHYDSLGRFTGLALDARPPHVVVQYDWSEAFPKATLWEFDGQPQDLGPLPAAWTAGGGWRQSVEVSNGKGEVRYRAVRRADQEWIISSYVERDPASRVVFAGQPAYSAVLELASRPPGMTGDTLTYDPLGRLLTQALPTGATRTFSYASFERTMREDTLAPVRNVLDGQGRVILTERTSTGGAHESVEARYDAAGRLTTMWLGGGQVTRTFQYDTLGRLVATSDPDLGARTLAWDDGDRLLRETNALGQVVRYAYDPAGRLLERDDGGALYRYHYDLPRSGAGQGPTRLVGKVSWIEEPDGAIDFGYDELGRTTFTRRRLEDRTVEETVEYTASGLVRRRTYDDGLSLTYGYDPAGRPTSVGDLWTLTDQDASGRPLREVFRNGVEATYQRDVLGLLAKVTVRDAGGARIYDVDVGRNGWTGITSITDVDGVGLDHTAAFDYDEFSRLTGAQLGAAKASYDFQYRYDELHNMTERHASGPRVLGLYTGAYRYGEAGQGPRQLTSIVDPSSGAVTHSMSYDAAGRQLSQDGLSMFYSASGRLTSVQGLPGNQEIAYAYGHDGRRSKTIHPNKEVSYWFSEGTAERGGLREHDIEVGGRVIARVTMQETTSATGGAAMGGVLITLGAWGLMLLGVGAALLLGPRRGWWLRARAAGVAGAMVASACSPGASLRSQESSLAGTEHWVFVHAGLSAGPAVYTDDQGALLEERRYEPFGEEIDARIWNGVAYVEGDPDLATRDRNALNKRTDVRTGWSDHGARWMAPEVGRWLTPDPPVQAPKVEFMYAPWDLHPYQYVAQNPIAFWDPDGNQKKTTFADADVARMKAFFIQNAANPAGAAGTRGNTNPNLRYSCIGTMNHGIEALYDRNLWRGNGASTVDLTQDALIKKGMTLGSAKVKYTWDNTNKASTAKASEWDTVMSLSKGDQGWSVFLLSLGSGYHSITITLDNRDTANPVIVFSDQNGGSAGWKEFTSKTDFDTFMKSWQDAGGKAYSNPNRSPRPLNPPPIGSRYVRLKPD